MTLLALKELMCTIHVLVVPNFTKNFVLECDALGRGLRTMLGKRGTLWISPINICVVENWPSFMHSRHDTPISLNYASISN